jgi:thiamine biosynthesis lipoprotein
MGRTFDSMGTTVSLGYAPDGDVAAGIERTFDEFDRRFSLHRDDSELSRVNAGRITLTEASDALREAYATALEWRNVTGGAFTPHRPDGSIDLNGIVKALAIERCGELLDSELRIDAEPWTVNAGGDVLLSGGQRIGIVDPDRRDVLLCSVRMTGTRRAVATSGSAERGDHIWGRSDLVQVTVLANDIVTADVFATAIVAGGLDALDTLTATADIDVLAVTHLGALRATVGMRAAIAA